MHDEHVDPNPASNPTRRWEETEEVRIEATHLVGPLGTLPRKVLAALSRTPSHVTDESELATALGVSVDEVQVAIRRVNSFAEAFGFVPLISQQSGGVLIDSVTATVVLAALARRDPH
ncbi:hypothetical protein [Microtetraspora malaysiensis]|uniref:Uncharacterized protein n=1 Tax=Microtetraspora malaysiensis TaxID=161358 RepID=A0ABW6SY34_9ACTN